MMSSRRPRRSNAASASTTTPPTGPCLLHQLPAELVKNIVELSIEGEDLAPYPHQQRTFELAGKVCRLWHDLLAQPQAYVVTDVLMAQRLAEKLKREGTGRSVRKLGIDYSGHVVAKGRTVSPVAPIAELLDECPRLLELILIGKYSKVASMMSSRLQNLPVLQRLELDINEDFSWRGYPTESFEELPQAFFSHLQGCPSLTQLDTGRLAIIPAEGTLATQALPATALGPLLTFDTIVTSASLTFISSTILASSLTLTTLHLGSFYLHTTIASVLAAIAPVAPNLVDFEWGPYQYWKPSDGDYPGLATLATMTQLRILETGSIALAYMLGPDALLSLPTVERLILNTRDDFFHDTWNQPWNQQWNQISPADAVVAFLSSPSSRGLKYFRLRAYHQQANLSWVTKDARASIIRRTQGIGIEVVFD
ncbi:hypothetical protein RQP46_003028 [Phenoliferia psychrophenolica]